MSKLLPLASDLESQRRRASRGGLLKVAVYSIAGAAVALPSSSCGDDSGPAEAQALCGLSNNSFNSSAKVQAQSVYSWSCSDAARILTGNGIPDHPVSQGNFATPISAQNISVSFTMTPATTGAVTGGAMNVGYAINSVKLDPGTAGTCISTATSTTPGGGCVAVNGHDPWRIEALGGAFAFGTDESNAHVQPNGQYHYHGMPEGILQRLNKGQAMALVAFAGDGFPIYARYGYTDPSDSSSPIKAMTGSWQKKATPDLDRPVVAIFPMGTFTQDYQFVAGSGDLDECNGRTGVTPEFPEGIYHYYITDTYPYIQRCVKGRLAP
jgi:hypothetical protein